jgi:tetratricopeptide (TPR) repeat protein
VKNSTKRIAFLLSIAGFMPFCALKSYAIKESDSIHTYFLEYAKVFAANDKSQSSKVLTVLIGKLRRAEPLAAITDPVVPLLDNSVSLTKTAPLKELLAESLAQRARIRGSTQSALADSLEAIELSPQNAEIRIYRALALHKSGNSAEAIEELNKAIDLKPDWYKPYEERQRIFKELGSQNLADLDSRKASLLLALQKEQVAKLQKQMSLGKTFQFRFEASQKLLSIAPRNSKFLVDYSQYLLEKQDYESAIAWAEYAMTIEPREYEVYNVIGVALQETNRINRASQIADQAVRAFPNSPVTLTNRALFLYRQKEPARALKDVNRALQIEPSFASAYMIRSMIYIALNDGDKALSDARYFLRLRPNNLMAYERLASQLAGRGELAEAYKLLSENLHVHNDGPTTRFNVELLMGKISFLQGDRPRARRHFEEANKISNLAESTDSRLSMTKSFEEDAIQNSYLLVPKTFCSPKSLESVASFGLAMSPEASQANYLRALALMCEGKCLQASSIFLNICDKRKWRGRVACQSAVLAFLCLERTGNIKQAKEVLERIRKSPQKSNYHKNLIELFTGNIPQQECIRRAAYRLTAIRTKALIAYHQASNKKTDEALRLLSAVKAEEEVFIDESMIAVSELSRLTNSPCP